MPRPLAARRSPSDLFLIAITWSLLALILALPLAWMLLQLALHPAVFSELRLTPFRPQPLPRPPRYNAAVAVIATPLATPATIVVGRGRGIVARILTVLLPVPLLLPSVTYAYGWSQAL